MTREEEIRILDPNTRRETMKEIPVHSRIEADQEACKLAVYALRAHQDKCGLTNEQLGRLVSNSYAEGYEDCKAGKPPLEKRTEYPIGEWISVKNRPPEPETEVFIRALHNGYEVLTTAMYEDGTISTDDSEWNWYDLDFDYDEERDIYLVPAGWWEYRHYNPDDVYNNVVDDEVTIGCRCRSRRSRNTMQNELKNCPFCGGKARIAKNSFEEYWVECTGNKGWCNVYPRTWNYETMDDAIEAWNRRVNDERL